MKLATVLFLLALTSSLAFAEDTPNSIGVYGHPIGEGPWSVGSIDPYIPFYLYVVAHNLDGGILGYEGSFSNPLGFDPVDGFSILSAIFTGSSPLNVGSSPTNFIVGTGGCVPYGGGPFQLVEYYLGWFVGTDVGYDVEFCLGPSEPTSFVPAAPGYLTCGSTLIPFTEATCALQPGCWVGNPTSIVIPTESSSWGEVKAKF